MSTLRRTYYTFFSQLRHNPAAIINTSSPLLYLGLGIIGCLIALLMVQLGTSLSFVLMAACIGIPLVYFSFTNLNIGLAFALVIAVLIPFVGKYIQAPIGLALDGLLFLLSFSMIVNLSKDRDWSFAKNSISYMVALWIYYNSLQLLNPVAQSQLAWLFTVRTLAIYNFMFYVASFAIRTKKDALNFIKFLVAVAFVSALYGLKQEFIGFSNQEIAWLYANEKRFQLIVQWGRFRVFSFFSDPTTFGVLMSYMSVFCLVLATGPFKIWQRIFLAIAALSMIMGTAYAGSRTPFILIPAGLFFYVAITMKKQVIVAAGILLFIGAGLTMKSTSNPVIYRIQSAFRPSEDASVQVRMDNQKMIQPIIQSRPFGSGLGSTGTWGYRFTPNSKLASFAHDSGYVRTAVEAGWLGLILFMAMLFTILRYSLYYYFRVHDPQIKTIYLALSIVIFILAMASYPQEVIPLPPTNIIFFILLAVTARLKDFDSKPETEKVQRT